MRCIFPLAIIAVLGGCGSGQDGDCRWPEDPARRLDLHVHEDMQHLRRDIELVEELSVRFADASSLGPGPVKQQYRIEKCYDPLMAGIVARHGVAMSDVLAVQSRAGERGLNLVVNIPVAVFFSIMTVAALRAIRRRFAADERLAILGSISLAGLAISAITIGAGRIWQMISETIRVGNGHLGGQRGLRLPWIQHSGEYFLIAMAAFAVIAIVHHAALRRSMVERPR
jgi:hypothetical protein